MASIQRWAGALGAAICQLSCMVALAAAEPAAVGTRGRVLTHLDQPVAQAQVFAVWDVGLQSAVPVVQQSETDSSGRFAFHELPVGTRILFYVRAEGHALGMTQRSLGKDEPADPLRIVLAATSPLQWMVVDVDGRPVTGAMSDRLDWNGPNGPAWIEPAVARRMGLEWPLSDANGRLSLSGLPMGARVSGQIRHPSHAPADFSEVVESSAAVRFLSLPSGVPFTLKVAGEGIAVPRDGFQLSMYRAGDRVPVVSGPLPIVVDGDGQFQQVVPAGRYETILLRHPELQTIPGMVKDFVISAGEPAALAIQVRPRGVVTGRVVDAVSGAPLSGQTVKAFVHSPEHRLDHYGQGPGWFFSDRAVTDAEGVYRLRPGVGSVRIALRDRAWTCLEPFVAVSVDHREKAAVAADVRRGQGITLTGLVTDEAGIPVARAVVSPAGEHDFRSPVCCDAQGRFTYLVEELTRNNPETAGGSLEFEVIDPNRPLARSLKVEVDPRQPVAEVVIRLQSRGIAAPPKATMAGNSERPALIGQVAPELKFGRVFSDGESSFKLADHRGKFVLLHFWATWCGPCLKSLPEIELLHELYGSRGLDVIGVHHNSVAAEAVAEFLQKHPGNHPTILDSSAGDICRDYHVEMFPTYVLIGPDGDVLLTTNEDRGVLAGDLIGTVRRFLNAAEFLKAEPPAR